jgi:hypothetical protein
VKERVSIALFITFLIAACLLGSGIAHNLYKFAQSGRSVTEGEFESGAGRNATLEIPQTSDSDRIYLVLDTHTRVNVRVDPSGALRQLSYDIEGLPFEYEDWILRQQRFLFIKNGTSSANLTLGFPEPKASYTIKAWQGEANYTMLSHGREHLALNVSASTQQEDRFQQVMLLFPLNQVATQDFKILGAIQLISGRLAYANLILITRDRNWFSYELLSNQTLPSSTPKEFNIDLYNRTMRGPILLNDFAKSIRYVAINVALDSSHWTNKTEAYAFVGLGDLRVFNQNEEVTISSSLQQNYTVSYSLHTFSKFTPTASYKLAALSLVLLLIAGALVLAKSTGVKFKPMVLLKKFAVKAAESDPHPDTYLAKLFHRPRYDKLAEIMKRHLGTTAINNFIDVGCGKGVFREWAANSNVSIVSYVGVDLNRKKLRKAGPLDVLACDLHHLPFRDSVFEVTLCSEVFEHVERPYLGFKEALRVSRQWVFLSYPDEKVKNLLGFRFPEHVSFLEALRFESIASEEKWRLQTREKLRFAFPPHIFDEVGLKYQARYQPIVTFFFQLVSKLSFSLALIKTNFIVFRKTVSTEARYP